MFGWFTAVNAGLLHSRSGAERSRAKIQTSDHWSGRLTHGKVYFADCARMTRGLVPTCEMTSKIRGPGHAPSLIPRVARTVADPFTTLYRDARHLAFGLPASTVKQ